MGTIVAIGGGEIMHRETLLIDSFIVKSTGKEKPYALFIPTASGDAEGYTRTFKDVYEQLLGCTTDVLYLVKEQPTYKEIKEKINRADIIYVGGGNTVQMMETWRLYKLDQLLIDAYHTGTVLAGLSAGGICWFEQGYGEQDKKRNKEGWWDTEIVKGLGLIEGIFCPHYNESGSEGFDEWIYKCKKRGYGVENNTALVYMNQTLSILKSDANANIYMMQAVNGKLDKKRMMF